MKEEIVTEGYFIIILIMIIATLVGARKRGSSGGIQREPPLSGDCFWQLEKSANPLCGNA